MSLTSYLYSRALPPKIASAMRSIFDFLTSPAVDRTWLDTIRKWAGEEDGALDSFNARASYPGGLDK